MTAWRGRGSDALDLVSAGMNDAIQRGEGRAITLASYASAVLANALGDYPSAVENATRACEHDDLDLCGWALIELGQAAVRVGRPGLADNVAHRLEERTTASHTDWGLGTAARLKAMISGGDDADTLYREALERQPAPESWSM